jgi:hypothetical protein
MAQDRRCGYCVKYYSENGECRADPPAVFYVGMGPNGSPVFWSTWPPVKQTAWCDKFVRRLEVVSNSTSRDT